MKGWIWYLDYPGIDTWINASDHGIYHILDAPHVLEMNKNPRWQCVECGEIVNGREPPEECPNCGE